MPATAKLALTAVALALAPAGAEAGPGLDACPARVLEAIGHQREAADIHARWITYIESGRATPAELAIAGDVRWHRLWIARYAFAERILRERCRLVE